MIKKIAMALIAGSSFYVGAQTVDFPTRPVTIVVPFSAGGPTDASARVVATAMAKATGVPFVVENVAGAGATIGAMKVARSKPDGYTLLWGTGSSLAIAPHIYPSITYHPVKSFAPIGLVAAQPFLLVVNPASKWHTPKDFVSSAKDEPGKLNFSSAGNGSSLHLVAEQFSKVAQINATHVPYSGGAPAVTALVAGEVDFLFETPTTTVPMIKSGKLKALAVTSLERLSDLPEVPTLAEVGYKDFNAQTWFGLVAPIGTPAANLEYFNKKLNEVLAQKDVENSLRLAGFIVEPTSPIAFGEKIRKELLQWGDIIQSVGAKNK